MRAHKEQAEKKSSLPPSLSAPKKKTVPSCVHVEPSHWLHESFYFHNYLSSFLAWANGKGTTMRLWYVPKFLPLPLAQVKNGDKQFWK